MIAKYPELKIYLMHAGSNDFEHAIRLMMQYSHVYANLGEILWIKNSAIYFGEQFVEKSKKIWVNR